MMEKKVIVAYASIHGATQEVAEFIAAALRERGLAVDLLPARNVRSLQGYDALVLGAPMYMFHLHKDAQRFLTRHRAALSQGLPVAVFSGGPFGEEGKNQFQEVRQSLEKELARFPWLAPVSVEVIGGRFDPAKLRFPYTLIPALKQMPASDLRDWDAIRAWANDLADRLTARQPAKTAAPPAQGA